MKPRENIRVDGEVRRRVMGGQSLKEKGQEEDQLQEMEGHRQKVSSGNYAQWQLNRQV
jgi:hypothetical protein